VWALPRLPVGALGGGVRVGDAVAVFAQGVLKVALKP
jgi:hypothetical protein